LSKKKKKKKKKKKASKEGGSLELNCRQRDTTNWRLNLLYWNSFITSLLTRICLRVQLFFYKHKNNAKIAGIAF
jgi:hypothetical protein